jgi:hypothetical protein
MTATLTAPISRRTRAYVPTGNVGKLLTRARNLQLEIKRLEEELQPLRAKILSHMASRGLTNLEIPGFSAVLKTRHHWTYSPSTQDAAHALRTTQQWEQRRGIAVDSPTVYIALSITPNPQS